MIQACDDQEESKWTPQRIINFLRNERKTLRTKKWKSEILDAMRLKTVRQVKHQQQQTKRKNDKKMEILSSKILRNECCHDVCVNLTQSGPLINVLRHNFANDTVTSWSWEGKKAEPIAFWG